MRDIIGGVLGCCQTYGLSATGAEVLANACMLLLVQVCLDEDMKF